MAELDAKYWLGEIEAAKAYFSDWHKTAERIIERYRDEKRPRNARSRYNVLWSNTKTLKAAVYSRAAMPEASRRHKDKDPVGRLAAEILERALVWDAEYYGDANRAIDACVTDEILVGRGTAWARYAAEFAPQTEAQEGDGESGEEPDKDEPPSETLVGETAPVDYVYWKDFLHSPSRCWNENRWVARRTFLTRQRLRERFGKNGDKAPLIHTPSGYDEGTVKGYGDKLKQAIVWEIWHKDSKKAYWLAEGAGKDGNGEPVLMDEKPDPLQLDGFWPCPAPLSMSMEAGKMCPVPDYVHYEDQAKELDRLTAKIDKITDAIRANALGNAAEGANLNRLFTAENQVIPIETWAAFAERGGMKGNLEFMPIDMLAAVRVQLEDARDRVKQTIYEITGLSDILRGSSDASETATAQAIKGKFASLRLTERQNAVAVFASQLFRLKAEIMCSRFQPETLAQMAGVEQLVDVNNPESVAMLQQAMQLLQSEPARQFRVEVNSDSFIQLDEQQEKADRTEFLNAMGGFFQQTLPLLQVNPGFGPMVAEMISFAARGFKAGRALEPAIDQAMQSLQGPNPQQQIEQMQAQHEQAMGEMQKEREYMQKDADLLKRDVDLTKRETKVQAQETLQTFMQGMPMQPFGAQA